MKNVSRRGFVVEELLVKRTPYQTNTPSALRSNLTANNATVGFAEREEFGGHSSDGGRRSSTTRHPMRLRYPRVSFAAGGAYFLLDTSLLPLVQHHFRVRRRQPCSGGGLRAFLLLSLDGEFPRRNPESAGAATKRSSPRSIVQAYFSIHFSTHH